MKMTKICTKCQQAKDTTDFYVRTTGVVMAECKSCARSRSKEWRIANVTPQKRLEWNGYLRDRRARIKDAAFAAYGGYLCKCCGESTKQFLTIDHIENDGADFRRKHFPKKSQSNGAGHWTYAWLMKNGYPKGFQVLCMNCNFGKRMNHGVCPHSTRCNDQAKAVEPSGSKRSAPIRLVG